MKPEEGGYALIAAVASIVVFALLSLMLLSMARGTTLMASAEADRTRLTAAADAGIALAVQSLMQPRPDRRWPIDGRARPAEFDGHALMIAVEDEHGKVALNAINQKQAEALFAAHGLSGSALETAVDGFLDWRDGDDQPRLRGAESETYAARGLRPRNGPLQTVGELALVNGIGPALAARIATISTVHPGRGAFDPRFASAIARRVSDADSDDDDAEDGVRLSTPTADPDALADDAGSLVGRPLTVIVTASDGAGRQARRRLILELTGADNRPYIVRARD